MAARFKGVFGRLMSGFAHPEANVYGLPIGVSGVRFDADHRVLPQILFHREMEIFGRYPAVTLAVDIDVKSLRTTDSFGDGQEIELIEPRLVKQYPDYLLPMGTETGAIHGIDKYGIHNGGVYYQGIYNQGVDYERDLARPMVSNASVISSKITGSSMVAGIFHSLLSAIF